LRSLTSPAPTWSSSSWSWRDSPQRRWVSGGDKHMLSWSCGVVFLLLWYQLVGVPVAAHRGGGGLVR
jgi:hypothetical protein